MIVQNTLYELSKLEVLRKFVIIMLISGPNKKVRSEKRGEGELGREGKREEKPF